MITHYPSNTRVINFGVWLTVGVAIGLMLLWPFRSLVGGRTESPTPPVAQSPSLTYTTYVLLGIDSTASPTPNIEAVWLAELASDGSAELRGLAPASFHNQYDSQMGLQSAAIEPYLRGTFAGTLLFDQNAMLEFVNRLGGAWLAGKQVSGAELLNFVKAADPAQPDDLLTRQAAALQGVLAQMAVAGTRVNYVSLFDSATLMAADRSLLFDSLGQYYPVKTNSIRIGLADN